MSSAPRRACRLSAGSVVMRRVASSPSISGMRMSITTTSGFSARTCSSACAPVAASPTTSMSSRESSSARNPARTIGWSSASTTLVGVIDRFQPLSGSTAWTRQPPCSRGPTSRRPPRAVARSNMPRRPRPASTPAVSPWPSSVTSMSSSSAFAADAHVRARRVGVAQHIGQCLLDDPEGRPADRRRDGSTVDVDVDVGVQPGGACLFHESGE